MFTVPATGALPKASLAEVVETVMESEVPDRALAAVKLTVNGVPVAPAPTVVGVAATLDTAPVGEPIV
jgi:hypothetical protein